MTTENIIKLLLSPCIDDVYLGLNFMKDYTLDDVAKNFGVLAEKTTWPGLKMKVPKVLNHNRMQYLRISDNLLCCIELNTLIFRDPNVQYNKGYKIIDL